MRKALYIIASFNIIRLLLIFIVDTLPLESFYFDNHTDTVLPFFVRLLFDTGIISTNSLIFLRLFSFFVSLLSQWTMFILLSKVIRSDNRKYISWIVVSITLLITYVSITVLPDSLLLLFWTLSLLTLYNAVFDNDKKSWLLSGLFMGMALLNKLSGLALPIGMLLFLIFSSRYRKYLISPYPYITLIVAAIISVPFVNRVIESQNISMKVYLAGDIIRFLTVPIGENTGFIGYQIIMIFPVLYIGLWWVTFKYFGRIFKKPNQVNAEFWFMFAFFLPLFLGFHMISFFSRVDFLGLIPVFVSGFVVLLRLIKKRWYYWSLGFSILGHILLLYYIVS